MVAAGRTCAERRARHGRHVSNVADGKRTASHDVTAGKETAAEGRELMPERVEKPELVRPVARRVDRDAEAVAGSSTPSWRRSTRR